MNAIRSFAISGAVPALAAAPRATHVGSAASYAEISDPPGAPVGSIGPTRRRCRAQLRLLLQEHEPSVTTSANWPRSRDSRKTQYHGHPLGALVYESTSPAVPIPSMER
jgi:hypothetical protein